MDKLYRIADANFNRAREGLRVLEDLARFAAGDPNLTSNLRALRHQLSILTEEHFGRGKFLASRSVKDDFGRNFPAEKRKSTGDIIRANSLRVAESLRTLEEMAALKSQEAAAQIQKMRFSFYGLEKGFAFFYGNRLPDYPVYVIIDPGLPGMETLSFARKLMDHGAKIFQLRAKGLPDRDTLRLALLLRKETKKYQASFLVNDRPDIAAAAEADGVHLGQEDLPPAAARGLLPDGIIGVSTGSVKEAEKGIREGADYLAVGSIFPTRTKKDAIVVGLSMLKSIKKLCKNIPVVAIGGITPENSREVFEAGADSVAVISALVTGQPEKVLKRIAESKRKR